MNTALVALLLPLVPTPQDPPDLAALATNRLAIDVYRHTAAAAPGENLFLSPWSISTALLMTAQGAREQTAAEMLQTLHVPAGRLEDAHVAFAALQRRLQAGAETSPATRERIAALQQQLRKHNTDAEVALGKSDYDAASASQRAAAKVADELNVVLSSADRYELRAANALWCEGSAPASAEFVAALDRHYGTGGTHTIDFRNAPEAARHRINDWVSQRTERHIQDLLPPGSVTPDTTLVLTNAVYFRGEWRTPFPARNTEEQDWRLASGQTARMRLMRDPAKHDAKYAAFTGTGQLFATPRHVPVASRPDAPSVSDGTTPTPLYPDDTGFQVVELPYKGGDLAMVLLLPRADDGLPALEQLLTAERLATWLGQLESRDVDTALPRFQQRSRLGLAATLRALGMNRAFVDPTLANGAQFEGIHGATDAARKLCIGEVFHQAFVDVSEKGTEAAAATAVTMAPTSAAPRPVTMVPFQPVFRADHPFVYLVRDTRSGAILFVGRVSSPTV
jgi:serine protease inhibitor